MSTETAKRKATMGVLDQLRSDGMPASARRRNDWTGEELPENEEERQAEFERQQAARTTQGMVNEAGDAGLTGAGTEAQLGVSAGPTGMSPAGSAAPGMVPYSPAELDRRSGFVGDAPIRTGVEALDQPPAKSKKRKKPDVTEDTPDQPAEVSGSY